MCTSHSTHVEVRGGFRNYHCFYLFVGSRNRTQVTGQVPFIHWASLLTCRIILTFIDRFLLKFLTFPQNHFTNGIKCSKEIYMLKYIYIHTHIWIYFYEKRVREPQAIMTSWRIFHKLNTPKQAAPQKHPHTKYSFLISVIIYHNLISVIVLYCLML